MDAKTLKKTANRLAATLDTLADLRTAMEVAADAFEQNGLAIPESATEVRDALDVVGPYVARQLTLAHKLLGEDTDSGEVLN